MTPATRRGIAVDNTMIFVPELGELRAMFQRFGREKDHERIALLDQLG